MFCQRVLGLAAGHEDLNDHLGFSKAPLLQSAVGRDGALAPPSTLCLFENRATRELNAALSRLMAEQFAESFAEAPEELVPDFDATDDPGPRDAGGALLPRLLRQLPLPAALRVLRRIEQNKCIIKHLSNFVAI